MGDLKVAGLSVQRMRFRVTGRASEWYGAEITVIGVPLLDLEPGVSGKLVTVLDLVD